MTHPQPIRAVLYLAATWGLAVWMIGGGAL